MAYPCRMERRQRRYTISKWTEYGGLWDSYLLLLWLVHSVSVWRVSLICAYICMHLIHVYACLCILYMCVCMCIYRFVYYIICICALYIVFFFIYYLISISYILISICMCLGVYMSLCIILFESLLFPLLSLVIVLQGVVVVGIIFPFMFPVEAQSIYCYMCVASII